MNVEDAVIGTLIREPHLLNDITLSVGHFQGVHNRNTYEVMKDLQAKGNSIDLITLMSANPDKDLGGISRLNDIARLSNPLKMDTYVNMVLDSWREREKLQLLHRAVQEDWGIEVITTELNRLHEDKTTDRKSIKELLAAVYEDPWNEKKDADGIDVGMENLQKILKGLRKTELIFIGARPSMGKTDVMLKLAKSAGGKGVIPVIHSLEMSAESLRDRLIAEEGRFNRSRMTNTNKLLTDKQKDEWAGTLERVGSTRIEIFDKPRQTVAEIRMKTRKIKNENPDKDLIVLVDYLTIIRPAAGSGTSVHHNIGDICNDLKELAKEFDCPVVCLAQLSRGLEQRPNKRPMMSDLRESGGIEEAADVVMFLYREAYYDEETSSPRVMEINVAKQRNGATGTVFVDYDKSTGVLI